MNSFVKLTIAGLMAFALQANAQQRQAVQITQETLSAARSNPTANRFLTESLGIPAASTLADVNKVLSAMSAKESALAIGALNSYAAKAKKVDSIQNQMSNEKAAAEVFMTGGKLLSVAAAAQGGTTTAAVAAKSAGECNFSLDISKADVPGAPNYATRQAIVKAGLLSRGNCSENPDDLTPDQMATLWSIAEAQLNAGLNQDSPDELRNQVGGKALAKRNGIPEADGIAALTSINTKCMWNAQKPGKMAAAAAR